MATVTLSPADGTGWIVPDGITLLDKVEVRAGGGSGGATIANTTAGGGGGGGAFSQNNNIAVVPRTNITFLVGQGGASVTGNTNGVVGNNSSWNNDAILAIGGGTGKRTNAAGAGGATASGVGEVKYAGGAGAAGVNATVVGGGGGAGASNNSTGNAGSGVNGGVGQMGGGSGGNGGAGRNLDGNAPDYPPGGGGGGSGGNNSGTRASGNGANGSIIITYQERTIAGITYDKNGNVAGNCVVLCYKSSGNNSIFCGNNVSNATTGAYSFTVSGEASDYFVVAFGANNTADTTFRNITPI